MATSSLGFDNFFSTTLNGAISDSDLTINLNAVPAASEGFLVIEPDSDTNREVIYYTSKGASSVTVPSGAGNGRGYDGTTAVSHSSGVTVKMNTVAAMFEALQDGTGLSSSFALPDGSVDPEDLVASTGTSWAWTDYTPALTATTTDPTLGSGSTAEGRYTQIGKTVHFWAHIKFGSSGVSAGAGTYEVSLPVTASANVLDLLPIGTGYARDDSGSDDRTAITIMGNSGERDKVHFRVIDSITDTNLSTSSTPTTWAANDIIMLSGTYEAA